MSKNKLVGSGKESVTNRAARLAAFAQRLLYAREALQRRKSSLPNCASSAIFSRSGARFLQDELDQLGAWRAPAIA